MSMELNIIDTHKIEIFKEIGHGRCQWFFNIKRAYT